MNDMPHTAACTAVGDDLCWCPDDVFWGRLLGDDDPAAPGKDWAAAAFGPSDMNDEPEDADTIGAHYINQTDDQE